jgi:hypothetical protein
VHDSAWETCHDERSARKEAVRTVEKKRLRDGKLGMSGEGLEDPIFTDDVLIRFVGAYLEHEGCAACSHADDAIPTAACEHLETMHRRSLSERTACEGTEALVGEKGIDALREEFLLYVHRGPHSSSSGISAAMPC